MPLVPIAALDDPRLDVYRDLRQQNPVRAARHFIAEGDKLVQRLLASRFRTQSILAAESYVPELLPRVPADVPVLVASQSLLESTIGFNFHRGCLACGTREPLLALADWNPPAHAHWLLAVCAQIQDPTNLGTLLRTCAAFGVDAVLLSDGCADPFSRRVLRVSMGAVLELALIATRDLIQDLHALHRQHGVELVATVIDESAVHLEQIATRPRRVALLFGSEGHGLEPDLIEIAQQRVTLPMKLRTDSLNVAVASGIFLYHYTRCASVD